MTSKKSKVVKLGGEEIIVSGKSYLVTPQDKVNAKNQVITHKPYSIDHLLNELIKVGSERILNKDDEVTEKMVELFNKTSMALGLSTHTPLADSIPDKYKSFAVEMTENLIVEYDCKTASEKLLVETIASSYIRILQCTKRISLATTETELSSTKNDYYSLISKELDRAQRHFNSSLLTLKQIKCPSPEINVKAKNAFISHNQQFNNTNEIND